MKRFFAILTLTILAATANAQNGLYISVNPMAALEPQAAYGMGVGYIFNEQVDICTEYSRLTKPSWTDEGKYTNIKGFRSITTLKLTTSTDEYKGVRNFVAAELRVRKFSFDDRQDFVDNSTHAAINNVDFKNNTQTIGLAALIGKQRNIGYNGKFVMEFTAGIGVRHTTVNRENTPMNATIVPVETGFNEIPNYRDSQTSVYFPLAIKVIMKL